MTQDMKVVYVYDDFSSNCPLLMGRLYVSIIRGSESYSFEYDNEWLRTSEINMALNPFLLPYARGGICFIRAPHTELEDGQHLHPQRPSGEHQDGQGEVHGEDRRSCGNCHGTR